MMSAKKLKIPPSLSPFASTTIRLHFELPSHVVQQTSINKLQRTILSSLERESFGIFLKTFDSEINVLVPSLFSDKAHNSYKYLKYIKLTGKREYATREVKRVSYLLYLHHRTENQTSFKRAV